jgi:DNA-directed RNA polymerase alpha subunit
MNLKLSIEMTHEEYCEYRDWIIEKKRLAKKTNWDWWKDEICPFTTRTSNCLRAIDIDSMDALSKCTENQLLKVPNLGRRSLHEIKEELSKAGLSLS